MKILIKFILFKLCLMDRDVANDISYKEFKEFFRRREKNKEFMKQMGWDDKK